MSTLIAFVDFGKYSFYVWPAYGIVVFALLMRVFVVKRQEKKVLAQLKFCQPDPCSPDISPRV